MMSASLKENILYLPNTTPEDSYIASPLYFKLTGRKGAWSYTSPDSQVIVTRHPHIVNTLMVFPEVGLRHYNLTACVLKKLIKSQHDIQLCRYTSDDLKRLDSALNALDYNLIHSIEIIEEDIMDWKYPLHILDIPSLAQLHGNRFEKIRNKYNAAKKIIKAISLEKQSAVKKMRGALKFWEGNMIIADKETDDMSDFYHQFFRIIDRYNGPFEGMMFYEGNCPVGFSVWEKISKDTANSFINLGDTSIKGLSDFQIVETCRHLNMQGIKYLNVGGSETESLDAYKRKFKPCKSIQLYSAKVNYIDFDMPDVTYRKFI